MKKAFTMIELLLVITIVGVLSVVVLIFIGRPQERLYLSTAKANFRTIKHALDAYTISHGDYPPDVSRAIPPELAYELKNEAWPEAPWPGSVYDWENWDDPDSGEKIYQISIRFCEQGNPSTCKFPRESWADDFQIDSSVYYCIQGPCRSHISHPVSYPGYCVNCGEEE